MINLLLNLKKIFNFSKVVKVKKKKLKIFISFLFINFVILSDLLIISILNFLITNKISENNIFNFLFSSNAEIYLIIFIITRYLFLFLDHILRESLRLDLDKSLKLKSVTDLFDDSAKDISIVSYEVNNESTMLGLLYKNLISLLTNSFQFIVFLIYIIFLDISVTLFLVIIGVLSSSIIYYQKRKNFKTSENYQKSLEEINLESLDLASNFYLIKILNIEDKVLNNFKNTLKRYSTYFLRIANLRFVNYNTPQFIGTLSIAFLILFFTNTFTLEIIFLILRMAQAFGTSNESYHELSVKIPFLDKYISKIKNMQKFSYGSYLFNSKLEKCILSENFSFKYQSDNKFIFENQKINIEKNSHNLIIGKNGTGKSTLLGVLAGVHQPTDGLIEISSKNIGFVGNKPFIFKKSLLENIKIIPSLSSIGNKVIDDLFRELQFYEDFETNYLANVVSKETLSDGQKQKLSFIRLLLQNPDIVFLDEAFSNLDYDSTQKIKSLIFNKSTVINVTHDSSKFENITNIFQIQNNTIINEKL